MRLVFLTSGIFMDPAASVFRKKFECLSEFSSGYVFGVVYKANFEHYRVGRYKIIALQLPLWMRGYGALPAMSRLIAFTAFVLTKCIWLVYVNRVKIDFFVACDTFKTGLLAFVLSRVSHGMLAVEVSGNYRRAYDSEQSSTGILTRTKARFVEAISPMVLRAADAVKLLYSKQVECFVESSHLRNVSVFHNVMPLDAFSNQDSVRHVILLAGHPWLLKGVDLAIDAFSLVAARHRSWTLKIIGFCDDPSSFVQRASGAREQIEFEPKGLPYGLMIKEMCTCSVLLLPSRTEAMGRVLLEAMAASKPIVASRVDGIPTYVLDGITGLLFDSESVADLADKLEMIMASSSLREELGTNGFKYVHAELNAEIYIERYLSMLERARAVTH
jgi:glycosyltransferase involved in cell wall biosynthesis